MSQDASCAAVRRFLSDRIGERLSLDERPDRNERNASAVEEVWRSGAHGYVVEHTRIEAFEAQIEDDMAFQRLVAPLEQHFAGALPGRFAAAIPFGVASRSGIGFNEARVELARLIASRVGDMRDGETAVLRSDRLPDDVHLHKRHSNESRIFFARWIEKGKNRFTATDETFMDDGRAQRIIRALDEKVPKLRAAAQAHGLKSVLILESNDIVLSNIFEVGQAFKRALQGRTEVPDLVFLVETDGLPFYGWLLKDNEVGPPNEGYFEDAGSVADED